MCVFQKRVDITPRQHLCLMFTKLPESWRRLCMHVCAARTTGDPQSLAGSRKLRLKSVTTEACRPQVISKVGLPRAEQGGAG